MATTALGHETIRDDGKPLLDEPTPIRRSICMTPVHCRARNTKPVLFNAGLIRMPEGREKMARRLQPVRNGCEERRLLLQRNVDDGVEGDDRFEAVRLEGDLGHVRADELTLRDVLSCLADLSQRDVDSGDPKLWREVFGHDAT